MISPSPNSTGGHRAASDDDGWEHASGTHVYRIAAGPHDETRKMILMK